MQHITLIKHYYFFVYPETTVTRELPRTTTGSVYKKVKSNDAVMIEEYDGK